MEMRHEINDGGDDDDREMSYDCSNDDDDDEMGMFNDSGDMEMSDGNFPCGTTKLEAIKRSMFEQKAIRDLAKFIIHSRVSPLSIHDDFFRQYLLRARPNFRINFPALETECLKIHEEEKAKTKQSLRDFPGSLSLSAELLRFETWGREYTIREYICVAAHFIDDNWKLKKWILAYHRLGTAAEDPHFGAVITRVISEFEIESKIANFTWVNDDHSAEMFETVRNRVVENRRRLQLDGKLFRVYCCVELFRSIAGAAFESISDTIDKIRLLVAWGKNALPKWDLTLDRLREAFELESSGEYENEYIDRRFYDVPSAVEWERARAVCELVESVYRVAHLLFEGKHLSAGVYFHLLHELRASLTQEATTSLDGFVGPVAAKMVGKFDGHWKDMFLLLAVAAVMDPRFKMEYVEFSFSCAKRGARDRDESFRAATVFEAVRSLYDDYAAEHVPPTDAAASSDDEEAEDHRDSDDAEYERSLKQEEERKRRDFHGELKLVREYRRHVRSDGRCRRSELELYLEEPVVVPSNDADFSALRWWKTASARYPILARMARGVLAIPMSVSEPRDAYCEGLRFPPEPWIFAVEPELVNALLCTHSWWK